MTVEEAIRLLKNLPTMCVFMDAYGNGIDREPYQEALEMAMDALKETQKLNALANALTDSSKMAIKAFRMVDALADCLDGSPLLFPCDDLWEPKGWCEEHCGKNQKKPSKECWLRWAEKEAEADD